MAASTPGRRRAPGSSGLSRRTLLLGLAVVFVLVFAAVFLLRRSGSSTASSTTATPVAHATTPAGTAAPRPTSTLTSQQLKSRQQDSALLGYARTVAPLLNSSAGAFDQALGAVSAAALKSPGVADLASTCDQYSSRIQVQSDQFEGIPHLFAPPSLAGHLYANTHAAFGDELAALTNCSAASDSKSPDIAAAAIAELRESSTEIHGLSRYAHLLIRP